MIKLISEIRQEFGCLNIALLQLPQHHGQLPIHYNGQPIPSLTDVEGYPNPSQRNGKEACGGVKC